MMPPTFCVFWTNEIDKFWPIYIWHIFISLMIIRSRSTLNCTKLFQIQQIIFDVICLRIPVFGWNDSHRNQTAWNILYLLFYLLSLSACSSLSTKSRGSDRSNGYNVHLAHNIEITLYQRHYVAPYKRMDLSFVSLHLIEMLKSRCIDAIPL